MKVESNKTLLYSGNKSLVYHQYNHERQLPVMIKMLRNPYPTSQEMVRFDNECTILQQLTDVEGVPKVLKKGVLENRQSIYMTHFEGVRLQDMILAQPLSIRQFLQIALHIAHTIGLIHHKKVIHHSLHSGSIMVNPNNDQVQVMDFELASKFVFKMPYLNTSQHPESTLSYLSPEQTGKINRTVDHHTDLYSLGVILYELLTQQLPFAAKTPEAIIHQHLTVSPLPLIEVRHDTPQVLSDIILKLLSKLPENRYQTAFGLQTDLKQCLTTLATNKKTGTFALGQHDFSGQLKVTEKLYGRHAEIQQLWHNIEETAKGSVAMVLISGDAGVGKSALVAELQLPLAAKKGHFLSGKYDQYQRPIPYAAIIQAFTQFAHYLLTENAMNLEQWRKKIMAAIGENGQVLVEVIPELERIIGQQPPVTEVSEEEGVRRFNKVFRALVQVICSPAHPLVIFIDDLQWADTASLRLLHSLITDSSQHYLLIIGAYRHQEVDLAHPLLRTVHDIKTEGGQVHQVQPGNLEIAHVRALLADRLQLPAANIDALANLVYQKTAGNAFFTHQLLQTIHNQGLLLHQPKQNKWQWDLQKIEAEHHTNQVVALLTQKVQQLASPTQSILKLASCLGHQFELNTLVMVQQSTPTHALATLWQAVEAGLVVPLDHHWQTLQVQPSTYPPTQEVWFMFLCHQVQQVVYSLIPAQNKSSTHLKIGRLLLNNLPEEASTASVFKTTHHFNQGRSLLNNQKEIKQVVALNLLASEKAMSILAYDSALDMLSKILEVIPHDKFWKKHHLLLFSIYNHKALCAAYLGLFESAQTDYQILQSKAITPQQIGKVYSEAIHWHTTVQEYPQAIALAREGLALLNIHFPQTISPELVNEGFAQVRASLGERQISDLSDAAQMDTNSPIAQLNILYKLAQSTWHTMPEGFAWSVLQMVTLSQNEGNHPVSSFGYAAYALLLCKQPAQYQEGLEYGNLALVLNKKMPHHLTKGAIYFFYTCFVQHWTKHKAHNVVLHQIACQHYSAGGTDVYGVYNIICYFFQPFCSNLSLQEVDSLFQPLLPWVKKVNNQSATRVLGLLLQVIQNLQGNTSDLHSLTNENFDETACLHELKAYNDSNGLGYFYFSKLLVYYTHGAYDKALDMAQQAQPYATCMQGLYHQTLFHFYYALTLCKLYTGASPDQQAGFTLQLDQHLIKLRQWASTCPENYEYQYLLVAAEMAHIQKKPLGVVSDLYESAVEAASKKSKALVHRALANELYAAYWLTQSREKIGKVFLQEANELYAQWGASTKVTQWPLSQPGQVHLALSDDLPQAAPPNSHSPSFLGTSIRHRSVSRSKTISLDFLSVIKALQTLTQETKLDNVLKKMLEIVIQNTGAQKGVLIDCANNRLKVLLDGNRQRVKMLPKGMSLDKYQALPSSVVRHVKRSSQPLVFEDVRQAKKYAHDTYLKTTQPKSVICLPIMRQNEIKVIFYLENNLTAQAFTKHHLEVLNALSPQMAISLDNALRYQQLEQQLNDQTEALQTQGKHQTEGIHYGQKVQKAMLPNQATLQEKFRSVFIIFKPVDLVSGNFYWFSQVGQYLFLAEADCGKQGVPGAFMGMLGDQLLHRLININQVTDPAAIVGMLHKEIKHYLKQGANESTDGMALNLCRITYQNPQQIEVVFIGAGQDLFYSHQGKMEVLKGGRTTIGNEQSKVATFKNRKILLQAGDHLYLASDGYFDAPNPRRKSFTKKKFIKLLQDIYLHPLPEQRERLEVALKLHQGETAQKDDITVIGVRL
ncbi:trifunctional serine/threonine-protein kinase/ATP-binding protein/SpoIIE family protein phosphatase [Microscilla marina]|uniref:Serine/threonine protein kinases, putative n=1 Tax=Microscilla marina ATCC 23134 TaxID=313606 RepID=A1ZM35_MICM2|nr:AAA family ATPase [Microscilla marina]EAY28567.1 serine/threonine protein kinases, putative [Microscilla marina ATCC 23134]